MAERPAPYRLALTTAQERYVEDVGLLFERSGMPRMAGRILGCLMVADRPDLTSTDLVGALGASKGSISTMTRVLVQLGLIERTRQLGQRADRFRLRADVAGHLTGETMARIREIRELAARGLELVRGRQPEQERRMADVHDLYAFLEREFPALLERWARQRHAEAAPTPPAIRE
ncbi:MAG TPA: MarR family transcriptional regulator [Candidatus Limnocylindrales bacterium]|nr:MarR family transcriptional regulator [Candidatus Limnocylindrales bacterium]